MSSKNGTDQGNYADESLVAYDPDQGLCLVDDVIVNLWQTAAIRKLEGKTLVYRTGVAEPIILPVDAFEIIRDSVFASEDDEEYDDEEYDDEDDDE